MAGLRGECAVKMKFELKFYLSRAPTLVNLSKSFKTLHMPKNITAAQKSTPDFHKTDMLAQTNQIKYNGFFFFFCIAWKIWKKLFSQYVELKTKIPGTFFRFYIVL